MDVETMAPIDDLEALFEAEDEDQLADAARRQSTDDPTAC